MVQKIADFRCLKEPLMKSSRIVTLPKLNYNPKFAFNPTQRCRAKASGKEMVDEAHQRESENQVQALNADQIEMRGNRHSAEWPDEQIAHSESCLSNHSSDIIECPSFSINFTLKAHCKQVNSIRLIKNDERVSFVTTSDDMMVKVYSL